MIATSLMYVYRQRYSGEPTTKGDSRVTCDHCGVARNAEVSVCLNCGSRHSRRGGATVSGDPYRTPVHPVPPRTSFVHPWTFYAIVRRRALVVQYVDGPVSFEAVGIPVTGGVWAIASDPDCPRDYSWPEVAPVEVAEAIRQGIADAKEFS